MWANYNFYDTNLPTEFFNEILDYNVLDWYLQQVNPRLDLDWIDYTLLQQGCVMAKILFVRHFLVVVYSLVGKKKLLVNIVCRKMLTYIPEKGHS